MIVDHELDVAVRRGIQVHKRDTVSLSTVLPSAGIWAAFFAFAILLQLASGAYNAEFSRYPDEPAHYVTSLMVREFILSPHPVSPLQFATDYYNHYPKVAFGHWPPFFYLVQALWMIVFSPSRASVLLELAATTAFLGFSVYVEGRKWFSRALALAAGALIICLPIMQTYTSEEMAETLLVLTCFWAAVCFQRYLKSFSWRHSLWFGVWLSLAVLTKGSGWLLAMVPPVVLAATGKLFVLTKKSFWIAPAIAAAICVPWQWMTMHMAEQGWAGGSKPSIQYAIAALWMFVPVTFHMLGLVFSVLAGIGVVMRVLVPLTRKRLEDGPAIMAALIVAVWVFHSIVPAGVEDRKMLIAAPALILFGFAGIGYIARKLPRRFGPVRWREAGVIAITVLLFAVRGFAIPHQTHYGFIEAAAYLKHLPDWPHSVVLISSASIGEGSLISEAAMHQPRPECMFLRATKILAKVDWAGTHYESKVKSPEDVVAVCRREHVKFVVVDTFPDRATFLHNRIVWDAVRDGNHFTQIATFRGNCGDHRKWTDPLCTAGAVNIYRFGS